MSQTWAEAILSVTIASNKGNYDMIILKEP